MIWAPCDAALRLRPFCIPTNSLVRSTKRCWKAQLPVFTAINCYLLLQHHTDKSFSVVLEPPEHLVSFTWELLVGTRNVQYSQNPDRWYMHDSAALATTCMKPRTPPEGRISSDLESSSLHRQENSTELDTVQRRRNDMQRTNACVHWVHASTNRKLALQATVRTAQFLMIQDRTSALTPIRATSMP